MPFRNKAVAALLAFLGGALGAPWIYLGQRGWWLAPALSALTLPWLIGVKNWWVTPAFFVFMLPVIAGFLYALVLALTPDERFDARFNPGSTRLNHSGWAPVLVAIGTLLVGATVTVATIVLAIQTAVEAALA